MAIWGDAIDNIPGVPGIGEKGAKGLIQQFGSLDGVYEKLDEIKKAAQRKALEDNREKAYLSRDLARIKCDLDLDIDFETLKRSEPDRARLHDVFSRLEFASLMQEFSPSVTAAPKDFRVGRHGGRHPRVRAGRRAGGALAGAIDHRRASTRRWLRRSRSARPSRCSSHSPHTSAARPR